MFLHGDLFHLIGNMVFLLADSGVPLHASKGMFTETANLNNDLPEPVFSHLHSTETTKT